MLGPTTYRLAWRRKMAKRYRALAALAILAVGAMTVLPAGVATTRDATIVTGHSVFYNGDGFDPCLASIVGIMRLRVMWFNDMVLVERYNGDGAYVYVTEEGAPDPTTANLVRSGTFYDFTDPNGVEWHVDEAFWVQNNTVRPGPITVDPNPQHPSVAGVSAESAAKKFYTWIVAVDKPHRDYNQGKNHPHDLYNFVTLVNTCKFTKGNLTADVEEHLGINNSDNGHENGDPGHTHETYQVNLWVGSAPKLLPVGVDPLNGTASLWLGGVGSEFGSQGGDNP